MPVLQVALSNWEKAGIAAGIVTAVFFLFMLIGQMITIASAVRAANAARLAAAGATRSNEAVERALALRERAWVGIGYPMLDRVMSADDHILQSRTENEHFVVDKSTTPSDALALYTVPLTNYGPIPATQMAVIIACDPDRSNVEDYLGKAEGPRESIIWPGQTIPHKIRAPISAFEEYRMKGNAYYMGIRLIYKSSEGNYRSCSSIFELKGSSNKTIAAVVDEPYSTPKV